MNSLLGLEHAHENPLDVEPSQDPDQAFYRTVRHDAYFQEIREAVRRNWRVSGSDDLRQGTTVIRIMVNQDGSLGSVDLLSSSGMILHDYEALEAIKQSSPFRSPPESLLDENGRISIRFSFHYFLTSPGGEG
jgi:TonB family protein